MNEEKKPERYPCSLCWQESGGKLIVPNVRGFNLGSGGHWYACEEHLSDPMFRDIPRRK
jgi:hypothetical protein